MHVTYLLYAFQTLFATLISIGLLYKWNEILLFVRNSFLRNKLKIVLITCSFYAAFQPANYGWHKMGRLNSYLLYGGYLYMSILSLITALVFEAFTRRLWYKRSAKFTQNVTTFCVIAFVPMLVELLIAPRLGFSLAELIENISFTLWAGCLAAVVFLFFDNYTTRQELALQQKELAIAKLNELNIQANLEALQSKINPHFLYNSLSAMAGLALEDGAKTSKMAIALSKLFRYNLNKEYNNLATVQEEVAMAETYLTIEKIRFEERLSYQFDIDENARLLHMPRFVLQPLIENCIKHGFASNSTVGEISVKIVKQNGGLLIEVADNGNPFPEHLQLGYGLQSLHQKMQLLFANNHSIEISNQPKKITITLQYAAAI